MLAKFGVDWCSGVSRIVDESKVWWKHSLICGSGSGSGSGLCSKIIKWLLDIPKNMLAKFGVDWCSGVSPIDETKMWRKHGVICGFGSGSGLCSKIKKWLLDVPKNMHAKFGVDWCSGVARIDETNEPLFAVKWHYVGYFAVIRIQIWIFDAHANFWFGFLTYCKVSLCGLICGEMP